MDHVPQNDAVVIAQVLAGDRDAFGLLVRRYSRQIFRIAFRVVSDEKDAEEVVQETWLRAYRQLARFQTRSRFSTWICRIAINCAIDLRARRPAGAAVISTMHPETQEHQVEVASSDPTAEQLVFDAQIAKRIGAAMTLLTSTERAAFLLRHTEGKTIEEISAVLAIGTNATKNCIFRAVKKMRGALAPLLAHSQ